MPRQTLGYIQLEWTCPNCNTRNKGGLKTCTNCGAPQPENVQFEAPVQKDFVKDENEIKAAQAGADIHCGFCGTRNPATAKTCSQCGADLIEGKARQAGREMQAPPSGPKTVLCTNCGTENPSVNQMCSKCGAPLPRAGQAQAAVSFAVPSSEMSPAAPLAKKPSSKTWLIIGGIFACLAVICIAALALFVFPASSVQATVTDVYWQTFVPVQELGIFPPMIAEDREVLVDGNVMNNMPLDVMREWCEGGTVIGLNPMPMNDKMKPYAFGASLSGWEALKGRFGLFGSRTRAPSILGSVMRATEINSANRMRQPSYRSLADVLIEPALGGYPILAFDQYEPIIEIGYQSALEALNAWRAGKGAQA